MNLNFLKFILFDSTAQDAWKTTLLLRVKEAIKAKELEEDDLTWVLFLGSVSGFCSGWFLCIMPLCLPHTFTISNFFFLLSSNLLDLGFNQNVYACISEGEVLMWSLFSLLVYTHLPFLNSQCRTQAKMIEFKWLCFYE